MSDRFILFACLVMLVGCNASSPSGVTNPSSLDGKANSPNSWHQGHVLAYTIYGDRFKLDDGTIIKLFFTGGTSPDIPQGSRGTIYVSVPSFDDDDADNTYYFQKFVPDVQP